MDYKKAYKEALKTAEKYITEYDDETNTVLVNIFPELAESKDERIRKEMIEVLGKEAKEFPSSVIASKANSWISWLEKQREQEFADNHADNSEHKFKVGDWVMHKETQDTFFIKNIENTYCMENYAGFIENNPIDIVDELSTLWTIQDAKDGDVLTWDDNKCIALFKTIHDKDSFKSYGCIGAITRVFEKGAFHDIENAHPATKEQRDLLFQKMKEAGYEWDADKKELKKIE